MTAAHGIIYATTPDVEAGIKNGHHVAGSRGKLNWARHTGREHGTFVWDGPHAVGDGWGAFKHVFSGGNGVVYIVEDNGDLTWWRHLGVEDGSVRWDGPRKVGTGWGDLEHVFPGGDGVIYTIDPVTEARQNVEGGVIDGGGGSLNWWRHLGVEDGSFRWDGPHKVGTGWGDLKHVFPGGDGVIYTIDPVTEARQNVEGGVIGAGGGSLNWWRHLGNIDGTDRWQGPNHVGAGWGGFRHVFSGGDGVIYTVLPETEGERINKGGRIAPSGGNLDWRRHVINPDGSSRWEGPRTVGRGWGASPQVFADFGELTLAAASREITQFWSDTVAVATVGAPSGALIRTAAGDFVQPYGFGSIIKPLGAPPDIAKRYSVSIVLAGIRCFGTDDPIGTDEPYVITSVYALDPRDAERAAHTSRHGPDDIGDVEAGQVFAQNRVLAPAFDVPGDGEIRLQMNLFDVEAISDPEKAKQEISQAAQQAIVAACAAITVAFPPVGVVLDGIVVLAKATGLLDLATDALGSISELFADEVLGTIDLRISNAFLVKLRDDPGSLERTSNSIGGASYNFPQLPEDDSPAGDSWSFHRTDKGTYRPFFRVMLTER